MKSTVPLAFLAVFLGGLAVSGCATYFGNQSTPEADRVELNIPHEVQLVQFDDRHFVNIVHGRVTFEAGAHRLGVMFVRSYTAADWNITEQSGVVLIDYRFEKGKKYDVRYGLSDRYGRRAVDFYIEPASVEVPAEVTDLAAGTVVIPRTSFMVNGRPGLPEDLPAEAMKIQFKDVPGGVFRPDPANDREIRVSSFAMSAREITRAQFMAVTGSGDPSADAATHGTVSDLARPVDSVSWYDAVEFCNKLSLLEGMTPAYTILYRTPTSGYPITAAVVTMDPAAAGFRLPTEAEWQWAAMGAVDEPLKAFAGSTGKNDIGGYAWIRASAFDVGPESPEYGSHAVGTRLPNELGLFDLSGNVREWCGDWFGPAPAGALTDYSGPPSGKERVARGGSWSSPVSVSAAGRGSARPDASAADLGFRIVHRP